MYGVCWRHHSRMSLLSVRPNRRNLRDMMSSVNISGERHLGALSAVTVYIVHVYRYTLKSALIHRARYKIDSGDGDGARARALRVFYGRDSRGRLYRISQQRRSGESRGIETIYHTNRFALFRRVINHNGKSQTRAVRGGRRCGFHATRYLHSTAY